FASSQQEMPNTFAMSWCSRAAPMKTRKGSGGFGSGVVSLGASAPWCGAWLEVHCSLCSWGAYTSSWKSSVVSLLRSGRTDMVSAPFRLGVKNVLRHFFYYDPKSGPDCSCFRCYIQRNTREIMDFRACNGEFPRFSEARGAS